MEFTTEKLSYHDLEIDMHSEYVTNYYTKKAKKYSNLSACMNSLCKE